VDLITPDDGEAEMPSAQASVDNLKGYCFFLDVDLVGVCDLSPSMWQAIPTPHTSAIAIGVSHQRLGKTGDPGAQWIGSGAQVAADVRCLEVATVLARYIGALGFAATAHSVWASDVHRHQVGAHAGILDARNARPQHPLISGDLSVAVVTTTMALQPDAPLGRFNPLQRTWGSAKQAVGWNGTRPSWRRLDGQNRPWHLGRYPMEKVPRVDQPTTLILEDEVVRPAARHNFFVRARAGDLGKRPQTEVARFIPKAPHGLAAQEMLANLVPLQKGEPAAQQAPGTADPSENANGAKALGHFLGADMVGICSVPDYAWYSHLPDGTPIRPEHASAVVFVLDQGFETMEGASGDDWISRAQSMRAYLRSSVIANAIAAHIRGLGYEATAHTATYDEVSHIPLLLRAGIGELSRIGELVLNPFVGPRFKSGVVTTNMPMTSDKPIDFGLQDFCSKCTKCARECPCGAIRFGGKVMFNGYEMWKPDVDRCARYRITNMRGSACGRCMKTCPYNVEGVMAERPFQWAAIHLPFARRSLASLDDKLKRGAINPLKKWWVDIELIDNVPGPPPKGANERQLNVGRKPRDTAGYAMFPPDIAPPGSDGMATHPVDRPVGIRASQTAETPDQARQRKGLT